MSTTPPQFAFSRTVQAPRDLVYKVWTDAEHLSHWFGPAGTKLQVHEFAFEPQGRCLYSMTGPDGNAMWGLWTFQAMNPTTDFTFISAFSDEAGTVQKAPFGMDWPLELFNLVTFTEADGKTTVSLAGHPVNATPEQEQVFADFKTSMEGGWGGTFDALEKYLETLQ